MPIELTLNIDQIGRNEIFQGDMAAIHHIANICNMKPGNDPVQPDKGLNLRSYKGSVVGDDITSEIEFNLMDQVTKYTPYTLDFVKCDIVNGILILFIGLPGVDGIAMLSGNDFEISTLEILKNT